MLQFVVYFGGCIETEPMLSGSRPIEGGMKYDWSGTTDSTTFNSLKETVIGNRELWVTTWSTIHSTNVPDVDFDRHVIYIDSYDMNDPNRRNLTFHADSNTLSAECFSTQMGYCSSSSMKLDFYIVMREDLTHYNKSGDLSRRKWPIK